MTNLNARQLAEVLVGIARSQQAIIDAVESMRAGFRSTHLSPSLMNVARVRDTHRAPQLADLPARVLMQCMGRNGPDVEQITRDIEALIARENAAPAAPVAAKAVPAVGAAPARPAAAPASAPAAPPPADDSGLDSLDMTKL
jgi:hypothetical protein